MTQCLPPNELPDIRPGDTVRKARGTVVWTVTRVERYDTHAVAFLRAPGRRYDCASTCGLVLLDRDPASVPQAPPWAEFYLFTLMDQIAADVQQETAIDVDPLDLVTEQGWRVKYLADIDGLIFIVRSAHLVVVDPSNDRATVAQTIRGLIDHD